jgi:hypothetical protein
MYLALNNTCKIPWDFGDIITPISTPLKNSMGEKILDFLPAVGL